MIAASRPEFGLISAMQEETLPLWNGLMLRELPSPVEGYNVWLTRPEFGSYDVVTVDLARFRKRAYEETKSLLKNFPSVKWVFFVGTCGANRHAKRGGKMKIGDVVIPRKILDSEDTKAPPLTPSHSLRQQVMDNLVKKISRDGPMTNTAIWNLAVKQFEPKKSGDSISQSNSSENEEPISLMVEGTLITSTETWDDEQGKKNPEIDYVDQEDWGFGTAAKAAGRRFLAIRGVSDLTNRGDLRRKQVNLDLEDRLNQERASRNAAAVCGLFMGQIGTRNFISQEMIDAGHKEYDPWDSMAWKGNPYAVPLAIPYRFLKSRLRKWQRHWPPKSYLISMLDTNLRLEDGGRNILDVRVPSNPVCIYNNAGKDFLHHHFPSDGYSELQVQLNKFYSEHKEVILDLESFPLRWASAGGFGIVTYGGRRWIVLFWRDRRPIGWNIPNGGSERASEWQSISELANREFTEELILLHDYPSPGRSECTQVLLDIHTMSRDWESKARKFTASALKMRRTEGLKIKTPRDQLATLPDGREKLLGLLSVESLRADSVSINGRMNQQTYIFSVNPREHGIETIRLFELNMDDQFSKVSYVLDGEIKEDGSGLLKRPVLLLSTDYLAKNREAFMAQKPIEAEGDTCDCMELPLALKGKVARKGENYQDCDYVLFDYDINERRKEPFILDFKEVVRTGVISDARYRLLCPVTWRTIRECLTRKIIR